MTGLPCLVLENMMKTGHYFLVQKGLSKKTFVCHADGSSTIKLSESYSPAILDQKTSLEIKDILCRKTDNKKQKEIPIINYYCSCHNIYAVVITYFWFYIEENNLPLLVKQSACFRFLNPR